MNKQKYNYIKVIVYNCGYGWEDVVSYEKSEFSQVKNDLKEYRLSNSFGLYKVVNRRVLNK